MNIISVNLDQIEQTIEESLSAVDRMPESLKYLSKLYRIITSGGSELEKGRTISKALWDGFVMEIVPRQLTMQMEHFNAERESFKLEIFDNGKFYTIQSSEITI